MGLFEELAEAWKLFPVGKAAIGGTDGVADPRRDKLLCAVEMGKIGAPEILEAYSDVGAEAPLIVPVSYQAGLGHTLIGDAVRASAKKNGIKTCHIGLVDAEAEKIETIMGGRICLDGDALGNIVGYALYNSLMAALPQGLGRPMDSFARMGANRTREQFYAGMDKYAGGPAVVVGVHPSGALLGLEAKAAGRQVEVVNLVADNLSREGSARILGEPPTRFFWVPREMDGGVILVPDGEEKEGFARIGSKTWATGYPNHPAILAAAKMKDPQAEKNVTFVMGGSGTNGPYMLEAIRLIHEARPDLEIVLAGPLPEGIEAAARSSFPETEVYSFRSKNRVEAIGEVNIRLANSGLLGTKSGERPRAKLGQNMNIPGEKAVAIFGRNEGPQEGPLRSHYVKQGAYEARTPDDFAAFTCNDNRRIAAVRRSWDAIIDEGCPAERAVAAALVAGIPLAGKERAESIYTKLLAGL